MRVAIVHEWLIDWAGSEQVVQQILQCFPEADLFALADFLPADYRARILDKPVTTSFLQRMPSARTSLWRYLPLMPLAVERFDLSGYDLIISSSHAVAKGIITRPPQIHLSYVHSPMRYAWDLQEQYLQSAELRGPLRNSLARLTFRYLRKWDVRSSKNPRALAANSGFVAERIRRVWGREARIIHPPVDTVRFVPGSSKADFFLYASRLQFYKRADVIVQAFASLPSLRLVVIGEGPERARLEAGASDNVTFLGYQSDESLIDHLQRARALLFAAEEDFGILPVEAQACGTPVIAFGKGGVLETVRGTDPATGLFFATQEAAAVANAVRAFVASESRFSAQACRDNAMQFSAERFRHAFRAFVNDNVSNGAYGC